MKFRVYGSLAMLFIAVIAAQIKSGQIITFSTQQTSNIQRTADNHDYPADTCEDSLICSMELPAALPVVQSSLMVESYSWCVTNADISFQDEFSQTPSSN